MIGRSQQCNDARRIGGLVTATGLTSVAKAIWRGRVVLPGDFVADVTLSQVWPIH